MLSRCPATLLTDNLVQPTTDCITAPPAAPMRSRRSSPRAARGTGRPATRLRVVCPLAPQAAHRFLHALVRGDVLHLAPGRVFAGAGQRPDEERDADALQVAADDVRAVAALVLLAVQQEDDGALRGRAAPRCRRRPQRRRSAASVRVRLRRASPGSARRAPRPSSPRGHKRSELPAPAATGQIGQYRSDVRGIVNADSATRARRLRLRRRYWSPGG